MASEETGQVAISGSKNQASRQIELLEMIDLKDRPQHPIHTILLLAYSISKLHSELSPLTLPSNLDAAKMPLSYYHKMPKYCGLTSHSEIRCISMKTRKTPSNRRTKIHMVGSGFITTENKLSLHFYPSVGSSIIIISITAFLL